MNIEAIHTEFQEAFDVSRETIERLVVYEQLLLRWNRSINLVARSTGREIWHRHFADSAQIWAVASKKHGRWVDLGSGGGFPGLVIATMAREKAPDLQILCVEADQRKAAFLRAVVRELDLEAQVIAERAETVAPLAADTISARALAPLKDLLPLVLRHLKPDGQALLPKGRNSAREVAEALESWSFRREEYPSRTSDGSVILSLGDIARV